MWLLALLCLACTGRSPAPAPPPAAPAPPAEETPPPAIEPVDPASVVVDALDRATLDELEGAGFGFPALLARVSGSGEPAGSLADLAAASPAYEALSARLKADIDAAVAVVERPLVVEHADALRWPAGNVGRSFDTRWLRSAQARLSLAGVVSRLDRRELAAGENCGEIRLIYRLAYRAAGGGAGSRLPLLVNVVLEAPPGDCVAAANRWVNAGKVDASWLAAGPLAPGAWRLKRVEVNAQVVRFPSGVETEFGGQAIYLLRQYALRGSTEEPAFEPVLLENTPDVARLRADPALRADLTAWINANAAAIDRGVYLLPERFLATSALSYSTLGINRLANKPFDALYPEAERQQIRPPAPGARAASAAGLIEQLNNGSCMGCHQSGSAAGFHLLGEDEPGAGLTNRLQVPFSPHFGEERARRRAYGAALASGAAPDGARPHSLLAATSLAPTSACLLTGGAFSGAPTCPEGTACQPVATDPLVAVQFGQCLPPSAAGVTAGMSCRAGEIASAPVDLPAPRAYNERSWADAFSSAPRYGLREDKVFRSDAYNCRPPVLGVPLGRAYRSCTAEERALAAPGGAEICAIVGGAAFDRCAETDFHACLDEIVGRGVVAACDAARPCREDHVCQRLPAELPGMPEAARAVADAGIGFCTPTYFLFQLRLDGHPRP